jgi:arginine decarboxylase
MPLLIRFADILNAQIRLLHGSFSTAIRETGYRGTYRGVYPIKVNQKQPLVEDIVGFGSPHHHGLEAGSKAELIAAVASLRDPEAFIICNGYKDEEFIDLALLAQKTGIQTFIVIERPDELPLVLERARIQNVTPRLGIRAKLAARAGGLWDRSGGDRSKFGMNAAQIIDLVDVLRSVNQLEALQMLHYHLGSQVPDIRRIRFGLGEATRIYVNLVEEGAPMGILNIGGGLAVDYDGSQTTFASSRNYSIAEYAADVVETVMNLCDESDIDHPMIVSESGRATVAHHSVLVFNVLDVRRFATLDVPDTLPENCSEMLHNLLDVRRNLTPRNYQEAYHDAVYYRDEVRGMFRHGSMALRERALAERLFWDIIHRIGAILQTQDYVPDEFDGLQPAISDLYYGNFSLFQSLPDSWAVGQLFPIMPIHRLQEFPPCQAVLADITCDSDGKIDKFIDLRDVRKQLPLHELNGEEYYLGVFLVGAYQETLGDMHNLLGDVNVLHIRIDADGKAETVRAESGDTVEEVLSYVEYDPPQLLQRIREVVDAATAAGRVEPTDKQAIIQAFDDGMKGYTYFER